MSIHIITDSTADIPVNEIQSHQITVIPVYINIGSQSYLDGIDLTREEFYTKLPNYSTHPTTSAPGPSAFIEAFNKAADEGATEVLSIHIAGTLSNVTNVARMAAEGFQRIPVTVFDSGQLTLGTGLMVLAAAKAAQVGHSMKEIVFMLEDMGKRTFSYAALNTLDYLHRGGRLSLIPYEIGKILNLKPILVFHLGAMKLEKAFTMGGAIRRMVEFARAHGNLESLAVIHSANLLRLNDLMEQLKSLIPAGKTMLVSEVTPAIGSHVGPGGLGMVCVRTS
jgi:DegV family protein with EDD domain